MTSAAEGAPGVAESAGSGPPEKGIRNLRGVDYGSAGGQGRAPKARSMGGGGRSGAAGRAAPGGQGRAPKARSDAGVRRDPEGTNPAGFKKTVRAQGTERAQGAHKEVPDHGGRKKINLHDGNGKLRKSKIMVTKPSKELLKDDDVRRWFEILNRRSITTSDAMLRRLNLFCHHIKMTPRAYADLAKADIKRAEDVLLDHIKSMEDTNYSPGYMECVGKAVKSWLSYNRADMRVRIRFKGSRTARTLANEQNAEPEHVAKMLSSAGPRSRVVISMIAFTGVRPQVMGTADGTDGLVLGDLPDLVLDGTQTHFSSVPAQVVVRESLSKAGTKYVTFLSKVGCEAVLGYLRERVAHGENLTADSSLVRAHPGWETRRPGRLRHNRFMTTWAVSHGVAPIVKSVLRMRVYGLRAYFDSQLLMAESNGYMTHSYRQFFMGHKGDIEARYTTNRGRLTEQMLEDMRRCYRNSEQFLHPSDGDGIDKKKMLRDLWKQQAESHGIDISSMLKDEGAGPDAGAETGPAGGAEPAAEPPGTGKAGTGKAPSGPPPAACVKVASGIEELEEYLNQGWVLSRELADNKYIMHWEDGA
ncbi:hypothetical protein IBTHAUMO2_450077 [Nitrosopumilaceae archaeon]|nr:hypothetical protein IBTHAUMO2_450077 [Nitrosopumilaceae archaeon]